MRQQTIGEIENRQPPRRISVAEGIALAQAFGLESVEELARIPRDRLGPKRSALERSFEDLQDAAGNLLDRESDLIKEWQRLRLTDMPTAERARHAAAVAELMTTITVALTDFRDKSEERLAKLRDEMKGIS